MLVNKIAFYEKNFMSKNMKFGASFKVNTQKAWQESAQDHRNPESARY